MLRVFVRWCDSATGNANLTLSLVKCGAAQHLFKVVEFHNLEGDLLTTTLVVLGQLLELPLSIITPAVVKSLKHSHNPSASIYETVVELESYRNSSDYMTILEDVCELLCGVSLSSDDHRHHHQRKLSSSIKVADSTTNSMNIGSPKDVDDGERTEDPTTQTMRRFSSFDTAHPNPLGLLDSHRKFATLRAPPTQPPSKALRQFNSNTAPKGSLVPSRSAESSTTETREEKTPSGATSPSSPSPPSDEVKPVKKDEMKNVIASALDRSAEQAKTAAVLSTFDAPTRVGKSRVYEWDKVSKILQLSFCCCSLVHSFFKCMGTGLSIPNRHSETPPETTREALLSAIENALAPASPLDSNKDLTASSITHMREIVEAVLRVRKHFDVPETMTRPE